ncbi:MAG: hypothetical protein CMB79_22855 [Filomicrobium sp.]|nr:hypothetical protein [Filomicrobium sp.]
MHAIKLPSVLLILAFPSVKNLQDSMLATRSAVSQQHQRVNHVDNTAQEMIVDKLVTERDV